ncbi:uncharacterized protein LACBIDRAFT_332296 [Laccaria bicolor S238N-H82]|uniref:Predicted protein n=1 Tax=Laccaria bicolor (strain S238N-H82 / ATCC MYA-4686) TaxID=486041 RepID=B0DS92_LACBS|nr:uncharacterized protein LACBIDRAFT_332296 [Laccaria bicolor S238N-H82]EDR02507.1 predicted protein [Laccaria bicolor S238N-H82]|eukprot:XP_001886870.1 predicted protein [Laccaria bicolor S238N-H82]
MQTEKGIKKAEKALASKKPELVTIEAHIMHATWKMNNTEKLKEEVVKDLKTRQENLFDRLRRDADKAQGNFTRDILIRTNVVNRKLDAEVDEKLQNVYQQLLQSGIDKHESEREARLKKTLASLQRIFPVKPINDKFRTFAKGAYLAVDVVQYEPAIERAIHHACGNALVCKTMEVARYVCYDKGQEVKAVALVLWKARSSIRVV